MAITVEFRNHHQALTAARAVRAQLYSEMKRLERVKAQDEGADHSATVKGIHELTDVLIILEWAL